MSMIVLEVTSSGVQLPLNRIKILVNLVRIVINEKYVLKLDLRTLQVVSISFFLGNGF